VKPETDKVDRIARLFCMGLLVVMLLLANKIVRL
jgi:hypothetical protein